MEIIKGAYTSAQIFTTKNNSTAIDQHAFSQIQMICNHESSNNCRIRIMPDVHPGMVGPIGLTITIGDKIIPNLIGIDIGCGMTLAQIKNKKIDYKISFQIIIFGMIGAFIGSMLAFKFNNRILKKFFGIFLLIIGFLEICSFKYRLPKKEDNKIK